jgi:hypothetical protein
MNYDDMTTSEIKKMLIDKMLEQESVHYVLGWLKLSYFNPGDDALERAVAIKQLKEYGVV